MVLDNFEGIMKKIEEGGVHTIVITPDIRDTYNITDKVLRQLNDNKYRISLLLETILELHGVKLEVEDLSRFTLLNHILPTFIGYCDVIIDEEKDEKAIKHLITSIKYGKKHNNNIVNIISKLCMDNTELRDDLLLTYQANKSKKNTRNPFKYFRNCVEEALYCSMSQIDIIPLGIVSTYTPLKIFAQLGIVDSILDDLKDFEKDYGNKEIRLKPNFINKYILKLMVNRYDNSIREKYKLEYEIFKHWEKYKHKHFYEFKFE